MPLCDRFRTALVTGAGSGLGEAITAMLFAEGVRVWGTSRDPVRFSARENFHPVRLELGDGAVIAAAWAAAEAESGGIDLLVNNAGAAIFGPLAERSGEDWAGQVAVLLDGPVQLAQCALPAMIRRGRGTIVNVTSLAVEFPIPYMAGYNAAKSALAAFTESLQIETAATGTVVIDFRPGDYSTNFNRAMQARLGPAALDPCAARVWSRLEALRQSAPPPARAARDLRRALQRGRSGVVRSGGFFQVHVAPWGNRLLPARIMRWLRAFYFRTGT